MKCTCEEYKKNTEALTACLYVSHVNGMPYRGDKFKFCPWCGGEVDGIQMTISQKDIEYINGLSKGTQFNFPR